MKRNAPHEIGGEIIRRNTAWRPIPLYASYHPTIKTVFPARRCALDGDHELIDLGGGQVARITGKSIILSHVAVMLV